MDRVDGRTLSLDTFWSRYLLPNRPVLITGLTSAWHCQHEWVSPDGTPDFSRLRELFGAVNVQVADCNLPEEACRLTWTLGEYLDYLEAHSVGRDGRVLYCKDVHLVAESQSRGLPAPYVMPDIFSDDWLNAYYDGITGNTAQVSDYRFTYLGPPGSRTPLHADVLRSHSWSANLCGTKHWLLFPPDQADLLKDAHGAFPNNFNEALHSGRYPHISRCMPMDPVTQGPGETIFVPAGWIHQVMNTGPTPVLSVNHNWFGVASVDVTWQFLRDELRLAGQYIDDIRSCTPPDEFDALVMRNMRANAGLDCGQFAFLVWHAVRDRMHAIAAGKDTADVKKQIDTLACARAAQLLRQLASMPPGWLRSDMHDASPTPDAWATTLERWLTKCMN